MSNEPNEPLSNETARIQFPDRQLGQLLHMLKMGDDALFRKEVQRMPRAWALLLVDELITHPLLQADGTGMQVDALYNVARALIEGA